MAAIGDETEPLDAERGSASSLLRRLVAARELVLVVAAVCASFTALEEVRWYHALAATFVIVTAIAILPRRARLTLPATLQRMETPLRPVRRTLDGRAAILIAALPDPCIVVNRRGAVVMHNEHARAAVPGIRLGDPLTFVLRAPPVTEALRAVVLGEQAQIVTYEEKVPVERTFQAHLAPIRIDHSLEEPGPDYVVLTLHDETNQQRLERMRVDFVANASHELRTPLASLSGFIETLQGPAKNDTVARQRFLEIMRLQAVRMSRLIDDLLSLSRIELNAHVRPSTTLDVRPVVAQTLDALGPLAKENGVTLVVSLPNEPQRVRGERDELYRVVENLVENAIKYGAPGGEVRVKVSREPPKEGVPETVAIMVSDDGPGIPDEHLPRLTERFYRVDTVSSREKGGTGLGLAIVKHILARHRGRLSIESKVGEGSIFTARLDAVEDGSMSVTESAQSAPRL